LSHFVSLIIYQHYQQTVLTAPETEALTASLLVNSSANHDRRADEITAITTEAASSGAVSALHCGGLNIDAPQRAENRKSFAKLPATATLAASADT
jgi:hypothetical protein